MEVMLWFLNIMLILILYKDSYYLFHMITIIITNVKDLLI